MVGQGWPGSPGHSPSGRLEPWGPERALGCGWREAGRLLPAGSVPVCGLRARLQGPALSAHQDEMHQGTGSSPVGVP